MHGLAYDEVDDLIVVPNEFSQAILIFRGAAAGEEPPLRVIQGPRTQLGGADRVAVDSIHREIFVGDRGQVLVFPIDAKGDAAPLRVLRGPATRLGGAGAVGVDPKNNVLVVIGSGILIFDRTADGNTAPLRMIPGSNRGEDGPGGRGGAVYDGLIFTGAQNNSIGVWSIHDSGRTPPRWRFADGVFPEMRGIVVDAKNQSVIITDKSLNAVFTYHLPEVFAH
jgi:hypothetical protein